MDEDGGTKPFKRLDMAEIKKAGAKLVAHRMTMTNLFDKTETITVITRIQTIIYLIVIIHAITINISIYIISFSIIIQITNHQ